MFYETHGHCNALYYVDINIQLLINVLPMDPRKSNLRIISTFIRTHHADMNNKATASSL